MNLIISILFLIVCTVVGSQFTSTGFPTKVLSSNSPWNIPIGNNPSVEPLSTVMVNKIKNSLAQEGLSTDFQLHYNKWTAPIHLVNTSLPVNRIKIFQPQGEGYHETVDPLGLKVITNLPVLTSFNPDPMADGHMIVFDTNLKVFHEFSRFKWVNSTTAEATRYDTFSYNNNGTYPALVPGSRWWMKGVRGSGAPFIAGLIRYDEIQRGELDHAIAFAGPINRQKSFSSSSWSYELCTPVSCRTDGWVIGNDTVMEGQRIQLNPSYNINSLPPKARLIAQALQTYGGYMVDNSGDFGIYFENLITSNPSGTSLWESQYGSDLSTLYNIPITQFRILTCSNIIAK
ncbi:hypothetical protein RB653_008769 [Dictyostelium firmibasis]|uniref:Uncharacterized protein n=1 Tax=Dictyostelium firmibasis TaxID=79012 RepID=A0AAN7U584_9MYCE